MNWKTAVIVITGIFLSASIQAEEKIQGAFGIQLGQVFDLSSKIGTAELTDGTPMYMFEPKKKFRSLSQYFVMITPKTNKVHTIWAQGDMENNSLCQKEQALVMAILQKKYGKIAKDKPFSVMYDVKEIDQGEKKVFTKCTGFSDVNLSIRYKDKKLEQLAENERILIESERVDASGL